MDSKAPRSTTAHLSSCKRVLGTTELLEHILRHLELEDFTRSKRVAQKWKAVIKGSIYLRNGDFGLPRRPSEFLTWVEVWDKEKRHPKRSTSLYQPRIVNNDTTLLGPKNTPQIVSQLHPRLRLSESAREANFGCYFELDWEKMISWPAGSWERQLITQPPCFELAFHDGLRMQAASSDPSKPHGHLTLGNLRDLLVDLCTGNSSRDIYGRLTAGRKVQIHLPGHVERCNYWVGAARQYEKQEVVDVNLEHEECGLPAGNDKQSASMV